MKDATASNDTVQPGGHRAAYLTDAGDIAPILKILRDHSAALELRLPGADGEYTGRILDLGKNEFLLQDVRPRDGLTKLRPGTRFTFAARLDGLYICGEECTVAGVESERGLPYFRASLPRRLLRQQRRRHTRIALPPRVSPNEGTIRLTRTQGSITSLDGQIIDISVGGCRAVFKGAVVPVLTLNETLPACELGVTATLRLSAAGIIRHSSWDAKQRTTTCGIEFVEMNITDRRRLEHYVQQLSSRATAKV